jgi:CDP-paratose 2-epimerase
MPGAGGWKIRPDKRVLVTGICGLVGSSLTRALLESAENLQVTAVDNFIRPGSELNCRELA